MIVSRLSHHYIRISPSTRQILAFCVFLSILFIVWGLVLIFLKLRFGVKGVGCAAGGDIVDVAALRANKLSRAQRKKRIVRAWRTQSVFLLATLAVPTFSLLLVNHGLRPFIASLDSLVDVTDKVDSAAFLGIHIVDSVTARYRELVEIPIIDIRSFCPNALAPDTVLASLGAYALPETLQLCLQMIDSFVQDYVTAIRPALTQVTDATRIVDEVIDSVYNHYWILKLLLLVLNVANGFFIFGVLLSKNGCVYAAFQAMMSYLILPVFALALIASVGLTCATVSLTLVNAGMHYQCIHPNIQAMSAVAEAFVSHLASLDVLQTFVLEDRFLEAHKEPSKTLLSHLATQ